MTELNRGDALKVLAGAGSSALRRRLTLERLRSPRARQLRPETALCADPPVRR